MRRANETRYSSLVQSNLLPPSRAIKCAQEYQNTFAAWDKLLEPHAR